MYELKQLEGRRHFVVPVVLITSGTFSGTEGPITYPPQVLNDSARMWNGRPVVVYHPEMASGGFADHPEIFNRQKIGTLFNVTFDGNRLVGEAWIDAGRVAHVDQRVLNTIVARRVMEVSTGMAMDAADGQPPTALRIYPDHLAVLPDRVGACSVAAGAGLCRNEYTGYAMAMAY